MGEGGGAPAADHMATDTENTFMLIALIMAIAALIATIYAIALLCRFLCVSRELQNKNMMHLLLTGQSEGHRVSGAEVEASGNFQSFNDPEYGEVPAGASSGALGSSAGSSSSGRGLPAARPQHARTSRTVLAPAVCRFEDLLGKCVAKNGKIVDAPREEVIDALDCYAEVLNKVGGGMGWHITLNTKKMRKSKTDFSKEMFHEWILTELPAHSPLKDGWQDDSAWMSNRWIGYMLEFFVDFFEELSTGKDSRPALDAAYQRTLVKHHTFLMRKAFGAATTAIPNREKLVRTLSGEGTEEDLKDDLCVFVRVCKPFLDFLVQTDADCEKLLADYRQSKKK